MAQDSPPITPITPSKYRQVVNDNAVLKGAQLKIALFSVNALEATPVSRETQEKRNILIQLADPETNACRNVAMKCILRQPFFTSVYGISTGNAGTDDARSDTVSDAVFATLDETTLMAGIKSTYQQVTFE